MPPSKKNKTRQVSTQEAKKLTQKVNVAKKGDKKPKASGAGKMRLTLKTRDIQKRAKLLHMLNSIKNMKNTVEIVKNMDEKNLTFLTNCLSALVRGETQFRMKNTDRERAQKILKPYQKTLRKVANSTSSKHVVDIIKKQKGEGFLISALISAAIPLITSLLSSKMKKK